jgi:hypothetical protein
MSDGVRFINLDPTKEPKPGLYITKGEPIHTFNRNRPMKYVLVNPVKGSSLNPLSMFKGPKDAGELSTEDDPERSLKYHAHECKYEGGMIVYLGDVIKDRIEPALIAQRDAYRTAYERLKKEIMEVKNTDDLQRIRQEILENVELAAEIRNKSQNVQITMPEKK